MVNEKSGETIQAVSSQGHSKVKQRLEGAEKYDREGRATQTTDKGKRQAVA